MTVKAVFFDLDDTLAATSEFDARAYAAVEDEAERACAKLITKTLVKDYKACLKQEPWNSGYPLEEAVPVFEHRVGLWKSALQMQAEAFQHIAIEAAASFQNAAQQNEANLLHGLMVQAAAQAAVESATASLAEQLQSVFDRQRMADFVLLDGVSELIGRLRRNGLSVVIITSGHEEVQRAKLRACNAADIVGEGSIIVGGEELRAGREDKPGASIFLKACALAGCEPSEAVMIGDSLSSDIQGAINARLRASIWVNPSGRKLEEGEPAPSCEVRSVLELEAVLHSCSDPEDFVCSGFGSGRLDHTGLKAAA